MEPYQNESICEHMSPRLSEHEDRARSPGLHRQKFSGSLNVFFEKDLRMNTEDHVEEGFMTEAKQGDTVKVHYKGTLNDGTVFDSSYERDPLTFTLGDGQIIPGFETAVEGMQEGDSKQVVVPSQDAYGDRNEENMIQVERSNLPDDIEPELGMMLQMKTQDEQVVYVTITDMDESSVTLDGNHPLAGKDLTFDIELLEKTAG